MRPRLLLALLLAAGPLTGAEWPVGTRVIVEKAGSGHRAIVLRSESTRSYVAYEGADDVHDEWVEADRIRSARPAPAPAPVAEQKTELRTAEVDNAALPTPDPLPHALELPRTNRQSLVAEVWLEQLARKNPDDAVRFAVGALPVPLFRFGEVAGIPTTKAPLRTALLESQGRVRGFAAIEDGVVIYRRDPQAGFARAGRIDLSSIEGSTPEMLVSADFDRDGEGDLAVAAGPVVQVFFGAVDGSFRPSAAPYRSPLGVRGLAAGRFFSGALSSGLAVLEGANRFSLVRVALSGLTVMEAPYEVAFERVTRLVSGDFDGDGFSDVAVATENHGRSTGAWMFFNQRGANKSFLWPVGGRDDFARDLHVADLDRDGRDDLVLTDADAEHGDRVRVVFGSAGRAGWESPWELISSEYGLGLGTASVAVADFNRDGRLDIGIGGRNGLRVYLGADYRRFSRNPVWPRLAVGSDFPEQRVFLTGDFDGDGAVDLLGYTPAFATGYNLVYNATTASTEGTHLPAPLQRRTPTQTSTTVAKVEGGKDEAAPGVPQLRLLASRTEPYGQFRYRIVVEVAALSENVIEAVEATVHYEAADQPQMETKASSRRVSDQQWQLEVFLPRGRRYDFHIRARDDKGVSAEELRVVVNP